FLCISAPTLDFRFRDASAAHLRTNLQLTPDQNSLTSTVKRRGCSSGQNTFAFGIVVTLRSPPRLPLIHSLEARASKAVSPSPHRTCAGTFDAQSPLAAATN